MRIIAFFNNKGGVGKTTLCFHLSHMLSRLGVRTLAVDLDPQANLTASFCTFEEIEELWNERDRPVNIANCLAPLREVHPRPPATPELREVAANLALLPGNLDLSSYEDNLSNAWLQIRGPSPGPHIGYTIAFWTVIEKAAQVYEPEIALVDVGPNLGAITRAALLATELVVIPLTADVFSIQGLQNLGPTLRSWREEWRQVTAHARDRQLVERLPSGAMDPVGYVVLQHAIRKGRPVKAYRRWFQRIPATYRRSVLDESGSAPSDPASDEHCIGEIKHYQSLVPLAQDANKPMFDLTVGDGAIGGHQQYVANCRANLEEVARELARRCELHLSTGSPLPSGTQREPVLPLD